MKNFALFFIALLWLMPGRAQLKCKTVQKGDTSISTCLHNNGKPSTIEKWYNDPRMGNQKRWGHHTAYDQTGREIFSYDLRRFAGHASVYLNYYANGQVSRAEYSSAPDGGIQFWRIISTYSEDGKQTSYVDLSEPDGHPVLTVPDFKKEPVVKKEPPPQKESVPCATPCISIFRIVNETRKPVMVMYRNARPNWEIPKRDTFMTIAPRQTLVADSFMLAKVLKQEECYEFVLVPDKRGRKNNRLIFEQPDQSNTRRVYTWHVLPGR